MKIKTNPSRHFQQLVTNLGDDGDIDGLELVLQILDVAVSVEKPAIASAILSEVSAHTPWRMRRALLVAGGAS